MSLSVQRLFRRRDPCGRPLRNRPRAVSDTVLVGGHIHHVAASLWVGHRVVALLVGEDDRRSPLRSIAATALPR